MTVAGKTIIRFILFGSFLFLAACSGKSMKFHRHANLPDPNVCRLAVLPFTSETGSAANSLILYRIFQAELAGLDNFELVQEGDVRQVYRQIRMIPFTTKTNIEQLQILGNYLNVQYLIEGNILAMGESAGSGSSGKVPFLTLEVRLVDAATGRTLWTTYHRRNGEEYRKVMHFGVVNNATQLAGLVSREILERWASEGLIAQCID